MTFLEVVTRVASRANKNINDSAVKSRIQGHVNDALQEAWDGFDWTFRHREYMTKTVATLSTGTVTATNGSQTITFSSAVLDSSAHPGAWVRFTGDSPENWYRIKTVSSSTVALIEPSYSGTTAAGKSYELKKTDYLFPSEIADLSSVKVTGNGQPLPFAFMRAADVSGVPPIRVAAPTSAAIFDSDFVGSTYSTGTVTGTIDTKVLTGSGTAWLANVSEGDSLTIGSNTYTVYKVDSDTSITLYNHLKVAASTSSYTITRRFGRNIRLLPAADDVYTIKTLGLRKYAPMIHDSDFNELLQRYASAVIESALYRELSGSTDSRETSSFQKSQLMWDNARSEDRSLTKRSSVRPIFSNRLHNR
jgi:hypothetical protein